MAKKEGSSPAEWRIPELIALKINGEEYTNEQVAKLMRCVTDETLDDCQLGALLMAIYLQGMTDRETRALTEAMRDSGSVFSWPKDWRVVDKHSTGGVGDKVSIPLAPALAACGLKVPMISGRGLGHTGGTLDKLESIPGLRVDLTDEEMKQALEKVGCCIVGQTGKIVPADRRMYSARDVTSTVNSFPLIVSSIISKKAAESVSSLVLDIKFGAGAFMETQKKAKDLARKLVDVANGIGMATTALLTSMDAPIGRAIGNALEIRDALNCLSGKGPKDLDELVTHLGGELMVASGLSQSAEDGRQLISKSLRNGSAREVFCKMIQKQGVTRDVAESLCADAPDFSRLPSANCKTPVKAPSTGVIVSMDAMTLGRISLELGAGRSKGGDAIDYSVGIMLVKVIGEHVKEGETWADLYHNSPLNTSVLERIQRAVTIDPKREPFEASRVAERVA